MSKRTTKFKRIPRDLYRTIDLRAGQALVPHLRNIDRFVEPCAGAYDLAAQLIHHGLICEAASDIHPLTPGVTKANALQLEPTPYPIITNPPWSRKVLHPMIEHFITAAPYCWLLFDADWLHTQQAVPYLKHCSDYVSVGRLLWIPDTTTRGKDNVAWYRFQLEEVDGIRAWPSPVWPREQRPRKRKAR